MDTKQIKILSDTPATGTEIQKGALVFCKFTGYLEDGTIFDSTEKHGRPFESVIGSKKLIAGWSLGLLGARAGGKRKFFVPSELAYGERQVGPKIAPHSNLIYEVEVLEVRLREG